MRNVCTRRSVAVGEPATKGPTPCVAPQIATPERPSTTHDVTAGPKRNAGQATSGRRAALRGRARSVEKVPPKTSALVTAAAATRRTSSTPARQDGETTGFSRRASKAGTRSEERRVGKEGGERG